MTDETVLIAVLGMAGVTYLTRVGGVMLMALVPATPRLDAFLRSVSSSVLVALVVPAAFGEGPVPALALAVAMAAMILTRSALGAMACGVLAAAAARNLPGFL